MREIFLFTTSCRPELRTGHQVRIKEPASQAAAQGVNPELARRRHWNNRNYGARKLRFPHATPDNSQIRNFNTNRIRFMVINPLNPELNPICYLLALLGAHHFLRVSRIRVKLLTFRLLTSYIYGAPILDVSRSHTTTQHSR